MVFDTQYLCVLLGKSVYKNVNGRTIICETFGEDCHYINRNIHTMYKAETAMLLQKEGATKGCLCSIREIISKYRVLFDELFVSNDKMY